MKSRYLFQKIGLACVSILAFALIASAQKPGSQTPRQEKLLNGLKVLMWNDPTADKVTVKIRVHSGSAFDPQGKEGVMKLLAENIFPNDAAREFFTDDLGGSLEIISNYDYIQINATSKTSEFLTMLDTLAQAVANPNIDKETTDTLKKSLNTKLVESEKDPAYVADQAVAKRLFGTFPYGRPQLGTVESVAKIDFVDLRFAKDRFFAADNATVTISGNLNGDLAYKAVRRYFGAWLKSDKKVPWTFKQPDEPLIPLQMVASPVEGMSEIRFAGRGFARSDNDYAAASLLASVLESRLRSKVPAEYRNEVFVRNDAHVLPGSLIFAVTNIKDSSAKPDQPKFDLNDLISNALSAPVTEAELNAAKSSASDDLATQWLDADTFKLEPIKAGQNAVVITFADVQRVADAFKKQLMVSVIVTGGKQ
jgi:zinc protease